MVKNGIDRIKISVRDMAESLAFFRDTLEMSLVAETTLDAAAFQPLWNLPAVSQVKAVYLKNDEQTTMIELLEVEPNSGQYIRDGAKAYDFGLFDVALRTKDIDDQYADLRTRGFEFLSAPVVYRADWVKVTVKEVIMVGPNRMPIALIERLTEPKPVIRGRFGTMIDVAQFVPSMAEAVAFYSEILGYSVFFNQDLPDGMVDELLTLPRGTRSRMALLFQAGSQTPAVELIQCSAPANSLASVTHPTRFGLYALAFETGDLAGLLARIKTAGFRALSRPVEHEVGVHGRICSAVVQGPNQVLLEFFQK